MPSASTNQVSQGTDYPADMNVISITNNKIMITAKWTSELNDIKTNVVLTYDDIMQLFLWADVHHSKIIKAFKE